jgi:DNA-binding NarL/FixJ family response regulator
MKTLLIVEDEPRLRESLVLDAKNSSEGWVVHDAENLASARGLLKAKHVDAMFVDLGLPDGDGFELIRLCRQLNPDCDILVITVFADDDRVIKSLEAGASGYILKPDLPSFSGKLISTIAAGGSPVSPAIARRLIERLRPERSMFLKASENEQLSRREVEILTLCARGLRYAEIASALKLSVHTVNAHLKNVYRKLTVNSKTEAIFEARRTGLIDD